jgi:polyisoprenoid-binding protein YceI
MRCTLILLSLLVGAPAARGAEFVVSPGPPNRVVFVSKAATETFDGKTDRISGTIVVSDDGVGDSVTVRIEVDVASLDTGIGKRNRHMRENHLETDAFPTAVFAGASVRGPAGAVLAPGETVAFDVEGTFTLHGVSRRMRLAVSVTPRDAQILEFDAAFPIRLADFDIARPKFLFLKLGEVQNVMVHGVATASH